MLHFIYKDSLIDDEEFVGTSSSCTPSVSDALAAKLLAAADKYDLPRLRLMCESVLCKDISVNSVANILALADRCHAMDLKSICLKFAAENLVGKFFSFFIAFQVLCLLETVMLLIWRNDCSGITKCMLNCQLLKLFNFDGLQFDLSNDVKIKQLQHILFIKFFALQKVLKLVKTWESRAEPKVFIITISYFPQHPNFLWF